MIPVALGSAVINCEESVSVFNTTRHWRSVGENKVLLRCLMLSFIVLYLTCSNVPVILAVTEPFYILPSCVNPACDGGNVRRWVCNTSSLCIPYNLLASSDMLFHAF